MSVKQQEKTRYNESELQEFDEIIVQKLEKAKNELTFYMDQISEVGQSSDSKNKGLDDGTSAAEAERMHTLAARQRKLIQHLENARLRIKNKVYGVCRESGKLISKDRLRAVPHATLSIQAKEKKKR